jgi:CRP-like cAMP-binding protein
MVTTMAIDASRLRMSPVFDGLTDEELERSAVLFEEIELLAGSSLIKEGDFSYRFFVVLDGEVDVTHDFDPVQRLGPGEICGEIGLLTGRRRSARVVAHTRCRVASLMTWDFGTLMEQAPAAARRIEAIAGERLAANEAATPGPDADVR